MNHIRSLYGRFFLRIMAVCYLLAGLLFVAAASIRAGNSQLSVCLILIAATVLLLFSAILLAVLIRAVRPRNSSENSQNETRLSFLTDLLNDEHYLGYSRQELASEMLKTQAQMNSLQSQINPHFLFNSLNAGAQLAMMEDAEQTGIFVEKMADFFRYNVKKGQEDATLGEELEAVDNYIYILNVRFAGDIHFSKEVDESLENVRMPSMILQPVVENAVNHGIRDIEWEGKIHLTVTGDADYIRISVKDNGKGMTQEQIEGVLSGNREHRNEEGDSTGIGMNNVISRLELYYEESGLMEINSEGEGKGTEAVIHIPLIR